ncbi:MAG: AI-2E family transporter [Burkholderiaceae bacterium]
MSARPADAAVAPDPLAPAAAAPVSPSAAPAPAVDTEAATATTPVEAPAETAAPAESLAGPFPAGVGRTAIVVLSTIAFIYLLQWAQKFLIPVVFGVFLAYTLNPLVAWLERLRIPRTIGTSLVVLSLFCGGLLAANSLFVQFESIVGQLPAATRKIGNALERMEGSRNGTLDKMKEAASALEKATAPAAANGKQPAPVVVAQPASRLSNWLLTGSMSAAAFLGQATMVIFLAFFLLISGETFKRKLVKITGPSLTKKKITVHILDDIDISIQRYMFMLLVTNGLLAVLMWVGMTALGLNNAGAWALAAGLLHLIPYFGPLLTVAMLGMAAFLQFGTLASVLAVMAITLAVATLVGTFITTWMAGRIARMNPAAVFIGLLFWGWLWGVPGLLLGIPIIVIVKVVTERVEGMNSIAELLGE